MTKKKRGLRRADVTWRRIDPYTHKVSIRNPRLAAAPSKIEARSEAMVQRPDCGTRAC